MDIGTTIITAITAGLAGGLTDVSKQGILQTYDALKSLLKKKFGDHSRVAQSIDLLETDPQSEASKALVQEAITKVNADQDPEIRHLAQMLLDQLKAQPDGEHHIMTATGSNIAQADRQSKANVSVNQPPYFH